MQSIAENNRRSAIATVWRFTSGQYLDGVPRTDAGWLTRGTHPLNGGRVTRWGLLSRAERAGVRLGSTAAATGTLYGLQAAPEATAGTWATVGAAATVGAGYASANWVCNLRHTWNWVRPLHVALEGPLGLPEGTLPRSYIRIPRDYPGREDVGRIDLPAAFVAIQDGDRGALLGHPGGHGLPEAVTAAGDDGDLAAETRHGAFLS